MAKHLFQGNYVLAWPRVSKLVGLAFAGIAFVRVCDVHQVSVSRLGIRRDPVFVGINLGAKIMHMAIRADSLKDELTDGGDMQSAGNA